MIDISDPEDFHRDCQQKQHPYHNQWSNKIPAKTETEAAATKTTRTIESRPQTTDFSLACSKKLVTGKSSYNSNDLGVNKHNFKDSNNEIQSLFDISDDSLFDISDDDYEENYDDDDYDEEFCLPEDTDDQNNAPGQKDSSHQIDLEAALAKDLNALSLKQRDDALYDIHGVANVIQETPELVQTSLEKLERCIQKKKKKSRLASLLSRSKASSATNAYLLAESQSPDYVQRPSFRLHFLRSKSFNIKAAGNAMFQHFKVKQALFGDSKLSRDITLDDLDKDDLKCLVNGHAQLLPVCDPAGRHVFVLSLAHAKFKTPSNLAKTAWYMYMSILEMSRSETLAKGFVTIFYLVGLESHFDRELSSVMRAVISALPIRTSSMLCCRDRDDHRFISNKSYLIDWIVTFLVERALRVRTRIHRGNHRECIQLLETSFGIPADVFPITFGGNLRRDRHKGWLKSRKEIEEKRRQQQQIINDNADKEQQEGDDSILAFLTPSQSDVLLGRGRATQLHIGNMRLRLMMEAMMNQFNSLSERGDKLLFSAAIVDKVKSSGGHFLRFEEGLWRVVSNDEACQKVAHDFRTLRTKRQQNTTPDTKNDNSDDSIVQDKDGHALASKRLKWK